MPELDDIEYEVYAVGDRVEMPDGEVISNGFETGQRGRVLTFAKLAGTWQEMERQHLTCIADSDYSFLRSGIPDTDVLLLTDYASIEGYALESRVLQKFLSVVIKVDTPTGVELLEQLTPILNLLYYLRAAVHWSEEGLEFSLDYLKRMSLHSSELAKELLERHFPGVSMAKVRDKIHEEYVRMREEVVLDDPRKGVRGHDIAPMIIQVLGLKSKWAHPEVVEGSLMTSLERHDLALEKLFAGLLKRLS
jgi:hypothetical protein